MFLKVLLFNLFSATDIRSSRASLYGVVEKTSDLKPFSELKMPTDLTSSDDLFVSSGISFKGFASRSSTGLLFDKPRLMMDSIVISMLSTERSRSFSC